MVDDDRGGRGGKGDELVTVGAGRRGILIIPAGARGM